MLVFDHMCKAMLVYYELLKLRPAHEVSLGRLPRRWWTDAFLSHRCGCRNWLLAIIKHYDNILRGYLRLSMFIDIQNGTSQAISQISVEIWAPAELAPPKHPCLFEMVLVEQNDQLRMANNCCWPIVMVDNSSHGVFWRLTTKKKKHPCQILRVWALFCYFSICTYFSLSGSESFFFCGILVTMCWLWPAVPKTPLASCWCFSNLPSSAAPRKNVNQRDRIHVIDLLEQCCCMLLGLT